MYRLQLVAVIGLFLVAPVWAAQPAAPAAAVSGGSIATPSRPEIRQRMERHQVEVARLQRDVARQELDSQRASQRLQQQDRQIAELRRKLSELQADRVAGRP